MEKNEPAAAQDRIHEVPPEHKILRDAMYKWCEEAPEGENRSVIVIQVTEKGGELDASSHITGNAQCLAHATKACMSCLSPENPVGSILRTAAIKSLTEIGMITPCEEPSAPAQPERPEPTINNNQKHE